MTRLFNQSQCYLFLDDLHEGGAGGAHDARHLPHLGRREGRSQCRPSSLPRLALN